MTEPIVIVGAGGFGREVLDLVRAINAHAGAPRWRVAGVVDDKPSADNLKLLKRQSVSYLGGLGDAIAEQRPYTYVIGIGAAVARRAIASRLEGTHWRPAVLVHPSATVGFDVALGIGTIVCAGARLTTNIRTGSHCHVDANATVGHDTVFGDYVRLNPGALVSGDCRLDDGVLIGAGATVINRVHVGPWSTVGAGACVVRDVGSSSIVKGVPAR